MNNLAVLDGSGTFLTPWRPLPTLLLVVVDLTLSSAALLFLGAVTDGLMELVGGGIRLEKLEGRDMSELRDVGLVADDDGTDGRVGTLEEGRDFSDWRLRVLRWRFIVR